MRKLLSFLLIFNLAHATAPTGYKNETATTKTYAQDLVFPNNQLTKQAGLDSRIETGNTNLLINPSFEHATFNTGWTKSGGVTHTVTEETTLKVDGKKSLKITFASGAAALYQSSTINASSLAGLQGLASVYLKTTMTDVKICAYVNGLTTSSLCVNIVGDGNWKHYNIPFIMGGTSNGIYLDKPTSSTGDVYVDDAFVGTSAPFQSVSGAKLMGTLTYAAATNCQWSTSSNSFADFAADTDCATPTVTGSLMARATKIPGFTINNALPGTYRIVASGLISRQTNVGQCAYRYYDGTNSSPVGQVGSNTTNVYLPNFEGHINLNTTQSTWNVSLQALSSTGTAGCNVELDTAVLAEELTFAVYYFPPESKIYSTASQDFDWMDSGLTTSTSGWQGFGTLSAVNIQMKRKGSDLYLRGSFTQGTPTSVEYRMPLPTVGGQALTIKSGYVAPSPLGHFTFSAINANSQNFFIGASSSGNKYLNFYVHQTTSGYSIINSTTPMPGVGTTYYIESGPIPIQEWSDYGVIVGSFAGIEKCANDYECTEKFTMSVSSSAVKSNENIPWATVASGGTGIYNITYNTNLKDGTNPLSSPMNCTASALNDTNVVANIYSPTATGVQVRIVVSNTASPNNDAFQLECQKGANDYKPKTAKVATSIDVPLVTGLTTPIIRMASINCHSSSSVTIPSGMPAWISLSNYSGTATSGSCTATLSGFTQTPYCTFGAASGNRQTSFNAGSSTSATAGCYSGGGNCGVNDAYQVICIGK